MKNGIRHLNCACCGQETIGRQWYNRDTGFGICVKCLDFIKTRETPEDIERSYGVDGINYNL